MELEVVFIKALRLLHSKAHESTEQLRQLLEDSLKGSPSTSALVRDPPAGGSLTSSSSTKHAPSILVSTSSRISSPTSRSDVPIDRKSGAAKEELEMLSRRALISTSALTSKERPEKRTYNKVKKDSELPSVVESPKRSRMESPNMIQSISRLSPATITVANLSPSSSPSSSSSSTMDKDGSNAFEVNPTAADIAVEMGLVCLICRSFDVTSGNTLVECQECHGLYHQECHKPPITDQDVNDPRLVWYCAKCTKHMKKLVSKTQKTTKQSVTATSTSSVATATKGVETVSKPTKKPAHSSSVASTTASNVTSQQQSSYIFKRVEPKGTASGASQSTSSASSSSPSSSLSNKPIGLAGLAASLSGKSQKGTAQSANTVLKQGLETKKQTKPTVSQQPQHQPVTLTLRSGTLAGLYSAVKPEPPGGNNAGSSGNSGGQSLLIRSATGPNTTVTTVVKPSATTSNQAISGGNGGSSASNAPALKSASGSAAGSSSLMSADKRLQIMKKKAAAKMQEKRRMSNK